MKLTDKILNKINLSPNRLKIFRNLYWAVLGKIINIISGLFVGILVARYLGPEQYGIMSYVISYVSLFSILSTFGFDNIEIRELAKGSWTKEKILGTALYLRLFFATVTIVLVLISLLIFESDRFTFWMIIIYALSLIFNTLGIIRNYFTSIVLNEYVVKIEITRTIIGAGIKIALLLLKAPLQWFIIAATYDFLFIAGGYLYSYRKKVGNIKDWTFDKKIARYQIIQSFPLLLSGAAVIVYQRIDQIMIRNMIDNRSVGFFSVAANFSSLIYFIPTIMSQTLTPILVRIKEENFNLYEIKKQQFVDVIVWISIVLSVSTSLCSYWIITLTFGKVYLAAVPLLQIMAFKTVGMALSSSAGQLIIIEKKQKWSYIKNIIGSIVCIGLNFWLIPIYGIIGSAFVSIITVIFSGVIGNTIIPSYRQIARIQWRSLCWGWKEIANFKIFMN